MARRPGLDPAKTRAAYVPVPVTELATVTTVALADARGALKLLESLPCKTQADIETTHGMNQDVQSAIKELEAERTRLTADKVKSLEADRVMFREPLKLLEKALAIGQKKIEDCRAAIRAAQEKAIAAHDVETAIAIEPKTLPGMPISRRLVYEILDQAAMPERFKTVNHSALQRAIEEGEVEIPGVRVYPSEKVGTRRSAGTRG